MDSASKSDQFEVIEEQIKDSNVVTFKSLSRKLNIHNTVAKQLLQEFLDNAENKSKYVVTLVVYGKKNDGDLLLSLVKESELPALKNSVSVFDQHIYSIQPINSTFHSDMIYNIDKATFELKQMNLSSIKYNKEIIRKSVAAQPPTLVVEPQKQSLVANATPPPAKEKPEAKKQESPTENSTPKPNNKTEAKKSIVKPIANSKGSISSFFQKQSTKAATTKASPTSKNTSDQSPLPNGTPNDDSKKQRTENGVSKSEPVQKESPSDEKERPKPSKTENTLVTDGLAKKIEQKSNTSRKSQNSTEKSSKSKKSKAKKTKQKKMRRIILNSDSSSNSEASEDESHISEPEFEEPEPVIEPPKKESPAVIVTHGKKRKRKVLEKTVVDDDGFMHTNKQVVYESCSSDENDDQVSNNENLDTNKRIKTDDVEKDSKPKTPSSEEVVKNQSQKTKQSSIMSFFKKPQKT